ncbi:hypothetical protein PBI_SPORTO_30 [Arthrobacter phage Sporto]|nr:hypothetical protein PBI_SPORTO_30 [Arthrobacter phage Sporto]
MDKTLEAVLTFAGTAGGSAFLMYLISGARKWLSGAAHREQVKNTSLARQRDAADVKRRLAEEHVAMLKHQVRELGHVPVERPEEE